MFLDASAGGSLKNKDESEARELVESMAQNEYRVQNDRGAKKKSGMLELDTQTALLAQSTLMNTQMAAMLKHFTNSSSSQMQVMAAQDLKCDFCGQGHANGECFPEGSEEAKYLANFKRSNPNHNPYSNTYNPVETKKEKKKEVEVERGNKGEGEVENEWLIVDEVEVEVENERVEEEKSENGVKGTSEGEVEKKEKLIDEGSILRKTKKQILEDCGKEQIIPPYVKLPYPHLKKKKEKEEGQFKKFMEMFTKLQVNVPFGEALEQMPVYAKFMKDLLSGKRKLKDDENIALSEECSAILQRKLPPKLKDPGSFTIPCSIGELKIGRALCDLGASINLMPLSMMKKLKCGEPKPTRMTLTLADRSVTYPYGVLEDVLVKVNDLLFPADFVILDMDEDSEVPLLLGRPFLATGRALIDVELGELMLRFQDEQVIFNVFEAMRHQNENPQCYRVDVIENIVEETSRVEKPVLPMENLRKCKRK
ncbi:unnamed protein product [Trifolium pratense]|uniref:Uncharacterized protein n=1 Tax=Trifolium pratense TaxID=57577 RepID=A0ACB0L944_TRIPR|nr:unnamed protein product [Trifolium pratense]